MFSFITNSVHLFSSHGYFVLWVSICGGREMVFYPNQGEINFEFSIYMGHPRKKKVRLSNLKKVIQKLDTIARNARLINLINDLFLIHILLLHMPETL
jgi:hypothetical protein